MKVYDISVIRGDGIGPTIIDAAVFILKETGKKFNFSLNYHYIDAGANTFLRCEKNITEQSLKEISQTEALLKGPTGLPWIRRKDGTEAGLLGGILRPRFDLYANIRPIRTIDGNIDYIIVRENTEGLYLARGKGVRTRDAVADILLLTRMGCERISRFAFELAKRENRKKVTLIVKSNVLVSMAFFEKIFFNVAKKYKDIEAERIYTDAACYKMVAEPEHFQVIVTENFIGDMISDLGGGTIGGMGLCPSVNIGEKFAYFEAAHGSAPDIDKNKANPVAIILSSAMMLNFIGEKEAGCVLKEKIYTFLKTHTSIFTKQGRLKNYTTQKFAEKLAETI
ncbi:MAG: isocitrate/isopropylmalate dehydrogenase family protein [Deltaproteobacteria bacterium]|nr:isocitrate/isopropylmalate dehydrogenase family protein [Deltaproteobacteria bacterium]